MCSTPRPKTKVKGKAAVSGTVLSNMSAESRSRFAARANAAQERRDKQAKSNKANAQYAKASLNNQNQTGRIPNNKPPKTLSYWLVSASLKEILIKLLFGKAKHV
ncbi:hypothetical protein ACOYR1_09270 [Thalassotalea piscium]